MESSQLIKFNHTHRLVNHSRLLFWTAAVVLVFKAEPEPIKNGSNSGLLCLLYFLYIVISSWNKGRRAVMEKHTERLHFFDVLIVYHMESFHKFTNVFIPLLEVCVLCFLKRNSPLRCQCESTRGPQYTGTTITPCIYDFSRNNFRGVCL